LAYPKFATAFNEISFTVLPKAIWNSNKSSIGIDLKLTAFAVFREQCKGFRFPNKARYSEASPSEIVLGIG